MSINVKPLADRVIIEPAAAEEKTAGGIIIPDTAKEKPQQGKIIAVGSGKKDGTNSTSERWRHSLYGHTGQELKSK